MKRVLITCANEAEWLGNRVLDVTSTEAPALFNLSPYTSPFELWHQKKAGEVEYRPESDRMKWGKRLQDPIAYGIAADLGNIDVKPLANVYGRIEECRLGASFDFQIEAIADLVLPEGSPLERFRGRGPGLLEIKKVDELVYRREWLDDDGRNEEAPKHIEVQLQTQLEVRDFEWGIIGVLIGGNRVQVLYRERDREMGELIRLKAAAFWQSIAAGTPPAPDLAMDAAFIAKLYGFAEPDKLLDVRGQPLGAELAEICAQYDEAQERYKTADEDKKRAKSALLMAMGDHEAALIDGGYKVSAGMVAPCPVSYVRDGYRTFRITKSKARAGQKVAA